MIAGSSSFHHVLTSQLLECGWSKAVESLSFCGALTSQLPERLEQGSASFVGEGHCFWNQTLRGFSGSRTVFQVSSSQGAAAFLTLVWWIQGMTPVTLTAVGGCQDSHVRACPNWLKWFLFPVLNPYLISWLIGMSPIAQENGCPF